MTEIYIFHFYMIILDYDFLNNYMINCQWKAVYCNFT